MSLKCSELYSWPQRCGYLNTLHLMMGTSSRYISHLLKDQTNYMIHNEQTQEVEDSSSPKHHLLHDMKPLEGLNVNFYSGYSSISQLLLKYTWNLQRHLKRFDKDFSVHLLRTVNKQTCWSEVTKFLYFLHQIWITA